MNIVNNLLTTFVIVNAVSIMPSFVLSHDPVSYGNVRCILKSHYVTERESFWNMVSYFSAEVASVGCILHNRGSFLTLK